MVEVDEVVMEAEMAAVVAIVAATAAASVKKTK